MKVTQAITKEQHVRESPKINMSCALSGKEVLGHFFLQWRQMSLRVIQLVCRSVEKVSRQFRTIEMARRLRNWSRLKVRAMVRFLWEKNAPASGIHSQIVEV
ncbi:hypothetical protein TNCV_3535071 [Trichonephila clavipes]|nr:hypothetical protein TNCV_3535071 [Trichonephila clavipes]